MRSSTLVGRDVRLRPPGRRSAEAAHPVAGRLRTVVHRLRRQWRTLMVSLRSEWQPNERILGGSRFGWVVVGALSVALGAAAAVAWVLSSDYGVDVPASVSFTGPDGYCDVATSGIGTPCFGDYSPIDFASVGAPPSAAETVYPASTRLSRLPFFAIERAAGFQAGLITFLTISAICLVAPAVWAVRRAPWFAKGIVFTVTGLATAPVFVAWDRGNLMALTVPLVFAVLWGLVKRRPWVVTVAIIACVTIRPQFALLALALVATREWRLALINAAGSLAAVVASFLHFGSTGLTEIRDWISDAQTRFQSQSLADGGPPNIAIPRVPYRLAHAGPWGQSGVVKGLPVAACARVALPFIGAAVLAIVVTGRHLPPLAVGASSLVAISLTRPLVYAYRFVFVLPIVAIVFRYGLDSWSGGRWLDKAMIATLGASLIFSLTPLLIPVGGTFQVMGVASVVVSPVPVLATASWILFMATLAASGVTKTLASRSEHHEVNGERLHG